MRVKFPFALYSASVEGSGGGGSESPPPAATPAAPEASSSDGGISEEIRSIMAFDPFEEASPPASTSEPPTAPPPETPPPAPTTEVPPTPPAPDPLATTVAALQQTVEQLPSAISQATQPKQPSAPEPDQFAPMADGQALNYMQIMSTMPDQVLNGLASENPLERKQAVAQIMGVGMHVAHRLAYKQAVETMRREFGQVLPQFVADQMRSHTQMRSIHDDFYGKFPQLSHPALKGMVMQEAAKLAQTLGVSAWDNNFRDRLGEHIMNMLPQVGAPAVPSPAPATPTMGASARPMNGRPPNTMQQEIADFLGM